MSSYESLIGKAVLSSDPAERQAAEDAVTVKLYASKALRDQSQFIVVEFGPGFGAPMPMDAATWDGVKDSENRSRLSSPAPKPACWTAGSCSRRSRGHASRASSVPVT